MSVRGCVSALQVGSRNYVVAAAGLADSGAAEPAVVGAAFAAGGAALGTLDPRPRASGSGGGVAASAAAAAAGVGGAAGAAAAAAAAAAQEYCLRFWDPSTAAASAAEGDGDAPWELNTRVDSPHQGAVTALVFHPHKQLAVTTSTDGTFKVRVGFLKRLGVPHTLSSSRWKRSQPTSPPVRLPTCNITTTPETLSDTQPGRRTQSQQYTHTACGVAAPWQFLRLKFLMVDANCWAWMIEICFGPQGYSCPPKALRRLWRRTGARDRFTRRAHLRRGTDGRGCRCGRGRRRRVWRPRGDARRWAASRARRCTPPPFVPTARSWRWAAPRQSRCGSPPPTTTSPPSRSRPTPARRYAPPSPPPVSATSLRARARAVFIYSHTRSSSHQRVFSVRYA